MFKVDLKVNGRTVRPDQLGRELEKAMTKKLQDSVRQEVSRIRCRVHGQHARVTFTGTSRSKLECNVSGCCDELIAEVRKQLP